MDFRANILNEQLETLRDNKIQAIEFGVAKTEDKLYPYFTFLRILRIYTPAGPQFALKELHNGVEGSGTYYSLDDIEPLKADIWKRVARIETPITSSKPRMRAFLERMRSKQQPLTFNAILP